MKVGDLVVRVWNGKPLWEMIGIIVEERRTLKQSGGADFHYAVKWSNTDRMAPAGASDPFGSWSMQEIEVIREADYEAG